MIVDAYTELMPPQHMAGWRAFGGGWQGWYQGATEELMEQTVSTGIDRLVVAPAAYRPGMARSLAHWTANLASVYAPRIVGLAALHPDDVGIGLLVDEALGPLSLAGVVLRPREGRFDVRDRRLDSVYARLLEAEGVLYVDIGPRLEPRVDLNVAALQTVLQRYPGLRTAVVHAGADNFDGFFHLSLQYDYVYLDLSLVQQGFLGGPVSVERLLECQDRVLFGSGFPNAPYPIESAIETVRGWHLGRAIEDKILGGNASRLLGAKMQC